MNLSKILVSVNIAATLPIAAQVAAQAANQTTPNEADSLRETVKSSTSQINHRSSRVSVDKKSFNLVKASPATLEVDGVKLRAFMPGRKLPSSRDLQLVSQQAQLAPESQPSSLNGKVSESFASSMPATSYPYQGEAAPRSPYLSTAPRVVLNQVQTVARQVRAISAKKRVNQTNLSNAKATSIAQPSDQAPLSATADFGQYSKDIPASWMANEKNLSVIETPNASPKEMAQIDRLIDQSRPAEATGSAGPPPFPLNLLPQQSLKQFVGARPQNSVAAPKVSFGSWHQGNQTRIATNLAPAGFHSNLHGHFGSYAAPHASHKAGSFKQSNKTIIAQAHHTPTPGMKIAAYAPYATTVAY